MMKLIKQEKIQFINSHRSEDHTFALIAKWLTGVKFILTRGDRRKISSNFLSRMRYELCDSVILTCQSIFNMNKNIFLPIRRKVKVIYGSVDEEHFQVRKSKRSTFKKYGISSKNRIVGIAGRTDYVKDQYTFVKAIPLVVKRIENVLFIISGKEEHIKFSELRKMVRDMNIDRYVLLLPVVDDIADLVDIFDISVITSIGSETISRVLLEYMYLKKPVIGTRVNAIGEIIRSGHNGELISPNDHKALGGHIIKLLQNKTMREEYGFNSYKLYKNNYSEEIFYKQYMETFRNCLDS